MAHVARVATQLTAAPTTTATTATKTTSMLSPSSATPSLTVASTSSKSKHSSIPTCGNFTLTRSVPATTAASVVTTARNTTNVVEVHSELLKPPDSQVVFECRNCSFETSDKCSAIGMCFFLFSTFLVATIVIFVVSVTAVINSNSKFIMFR